MFRILFWPTVRQKCSSDQKNYSKFDTEDLEIIGTIYSNSESSEQFLKQNTLFNFLAILYIWTIKMPFEINDWVIVVRKSWFRMAKFRVTVYYVLSKFWSERGNLKRFENDFTQIYFFEKCPRYKRSTLCLKRGLFFSEP